MKRIVPLKTLLLGISLSISFFFAGAQSCTPQGNQTTFGSGNIWTGYVYQGSNFNTYKGYVNEGVPSSPNFDRNFGGNQVNYTTNGCATYTDTFSVRYKLTQTFSNINFDITVGGDDGYRLSLDGGSTWVINQWTDHSYQTSTINVTLNGTYNIVLEYYERYGDNRISFDMVASCMGNGDQTIYGTGNNWIGYLYQGMNFNAYKGFINRGGANAAFDENFGTANGPFGTSNCSINTQSFSARFRLRKTFVAGTYTFTVAGDDGYRLSLNGGSTWVINHWVDQSYNSTTYTVSLNGTYDMVLEFYENGGDNRLSFTMSSSSVLPVSISKWSALLFASNKARLTWTADHAINFDHFLVQRSTDGNLFSSIKNVSSINSNSSLSYQYNFTDEQVPGGIVYYRLAMVDKDGSIRFSTVQIVSNKATEGIRLFPTVVENRQVIARSAQPIGAGSVDIFNMNGQLVQSVTLLPGSLSQSVVIRNDLPAATYICKISDRQGSLLTQKIVLK